MQPAVSVSSRGAFGAAVLLTFVAAVAPPGREAAERVTAAPAAAIDDSWHHANHLAWAIEHRRYDEIAAKASRIGDTSPYAPWVPAAIGLAVEQLDATAGAYVQMGRCHELGSFLRRVERAWPAGRAAMRAVSCGTVSHRGTGKAQMISAVGGKASRRALHAFAEERDREPLHELDIARAVGDHARALASCGAIEGDGPLPAGCLVEACRAGELSIAEILLPYGDVPARLACAEAGVTFASGIARAHGVWRPADLLHVHPDAPPVAGVIIDR